MSATADWQLAALCSNEGSATRQGKPCRGCTYCLLADTNMQSLLAAALTSGQHDLHAIYVLQLGAPLLLCGGQLELVLQLQPAEKTGNNIRDHHRSEEDLGKVLAALDTHPVNLSNASQLPMPCQHTPSSTPGGSRPGSNQSSHPPLVLGNALPAAHAVPVQPLQHFTRQRPGFRYSSHPPFVLSDALPAAHAMPAHPQQQLCVVLRGPPAVLRPARQLRRGVHVEAVDGVGGRLLNLQSRRATAT